MAIRVLVSGSGKMGRQVLEALAAEADLEAAGAVDALSTGDTIDGVPLAQDLSIIERVRPDVAVDFSNAAWTPELARACLTAGVRLVIGTTGLSDKFLRELEDGCRAKGLGAVVAPNFALGAVLMTHLARIAAPHFDYAEVIELHHEGKVDAPSGTSLNTAREMLAARGRPFERNVAEKETLPGTRGGSVEGVTVHSVRLPGLVAHQEVIFGGRGETLSIRHDSTGRESFMPGVMLAVREVMKRTELVRGMEELLGLR